MLLFVSQDLQNIIEQPLVNSPISQIKTPRSATVPINVQFSAPGGIYDPEILEASIASITQANPAVITTQESHGYTTGDTVVISGCVGAPQAITGSSVATSTVVTAPAHGLTTGDVVTIAGHSTTAELDADILASSAASPSVITTDGPHGLTTGDTIAISDHDGTPTNITASNPINLTATITSASPAVITTTPQTLVAGDEVIFNTTGALYTGLSIGVSYYVLTAGLTATTFRVSLTPGGSAINTSGSQSGVHTVFLPYAQVTDIAHGLLTADVVTISGHGTVSAISAAIASSSVASQSVITTPSAHGLTSGDIVTISGHTGSSPAIAGPYAVTVLDGLTFSINLTVGTAGTGGTFTRSAANINGALSVTVTDSNNFIVPALISASRTGGTAQRATSTPTIDGTRTVTVLSATTFSIPVAVTLPGIGGTLVRAANDINGSWVATVLTSNTFSIPDPVTTPGTGGTVTRATSTPDINGSHVITVIDGLHFSIPISLTLAGIGGDIQRTVAMGLRWTVKAVNEFDEEPALAMISPGGFIKQGSGNNTIFKGQCNYITAALNGLFGIEAPIGPNVLTSISNATPCVVTMAAPQAFSAGDIVTFMTTGTLPAPLIVGQEYYILAPTSTTFNIALTLAGAAINTTNAGSGTHSYVRFKSSDDVVEVEAMAELSWGGAEPGKTNWVPHAIRNDLYKSGGAPPVTTNGANGKTAIGSGVSSVSVTFTTALSGAAWHFLGTPIISNTVDGSPLNLTVETLTARSASGFTIQLAGTTDSANYVLEWSVALD